LSGEPLEAGQGAREVRYNRALWGDSEVARLIAALIDVNISHRLEESELVVVANDEQTVDGILALSVTTTAQERLQWSGTWWNKAGSEESNLPATWPGVASTVPGSRNAGTSDNQTNIVVDQLVKLKSSLDSGALSQAECETAKARVLGAFPAEPEHARPGVAEHAAPTSSGFNSHLPPEDLV